MDSTPEYLPYDLSARERYAPQPSYLADNAVWARSEFDRDVVTLSNSDAWRRLGDKTQVDGVTSTSSSRWRMAHSLEVGKVAQAIGGALGCDRDLLEFAGMAHDLGHPPFGHNGEKALDEVAAECGGFEGNAQSFRILTRLEHKAVAADGTPAGLNLTRASLDSTSKYPWPRREGGKKFGVYDDDLPTFEWMRQGAPDGKVCLEAQVMDFADDVAYSLSDLEDGVRCGLVSPSRLLDETERAALCETAAAEFSSESPERLRAVLDQFLDEHGAALKQLGDYDDGKHARHELEALTEALRQRFITEAITTTRAAHPEGAPLRRYDADLRVPDETRALIALFKAVNHRYVINDPQVRQARARERRVIKDLAATYLVRPELLDPDSRREFAAAADDAARIRVVVDRIARMTNSSATHWHSVHVLGRRVHPETRANTSHRRPPDPRPSQARARALGLFGMR